MNRESKIYIAGHRGLVGSAIVRNLSLNGYNNLIYKNSSELDLTIQSDVEYYFKWEKPEYIFLAAAKVGGIHANNTKRAEFIFSNLQIQMNVIDTAFRHNVKKLLFLGSSCIYPKLSHQPIKEEYLLTGKLEPTNQPYAIAKIAGIEICNAYRHQYGSNFISVMPTNLYGPNDNYDLQGSHVLPALLRKFHTAKKENLPTVTIWGTGNPRREFLHVDDMADACVYLMHHHNSDQIVNIGTGEDLSILELAQAIKKIVGYKGEIVHDLDKPDGTPRKQLDVSLLHSLGWAHKISLMEGITEVYKTLESEDWY